MNAAKYCFLREKRFFTEFIFESFALPRINVAKGQNDNGAGFMELSYD